MRLTLAGWDVLVLEKSSEPPARSPTGAGLGLDTQARQIIKTWLPHPHLLDEITFPLSIEQNQLTDTEKKVTRVLTRNESFDFRAAYWPDIHSLFCTTLCLKPCFIGAISLCPISIQRIFSVSPPILEELFSCYI